MTSDQLPDDVFDAMVPDDDVQGDLLDSPRHGRKPAPGDQQRRELLMSEKRNGWLGGEDQNAGSRQRPTRWLTPTPVVRALGEFDLDPCGAPGHELAQRTYLLENGEDGLTLPWTGRVWMNPPYGAEAYPFLEKLADHGNGVALIFARTETRAFVRYVWERADAVLFIAGRLVFWDADKVPAKANAGAPSCLVAYGSNNVDALRRSGLGTVVTW